MLVGVPATAGARTWSVPTTVPVEGARAGGDALEDAVMVRLNAARADLGLPKIWNYDVCTDDLAEQWGARIARTGVLEHRDQGEVVRRCRRAWAGEALVRGEGLTPELMVELWLASPEHREILLNPGARRAGVAVTQDAQGRVVGVLDLVRRQ
jgi:uncharacterized protein YkwD